MPSRPASGSQLPLALALFVLGAGAAGPLGLLPSARAESGARIYLPLGLKRGQPERPVNQPSRTPPPGASATAPVIEPTPTQGGVAPSPSAPPPAPTAGPSPTASAASRLLPGWRQVTDPNLVLDLAIDPAGADVWSAGRYGGAGRWQAGSGLVGRLGLAEGLGSVAVERVALGPGGQLWLGGDDGRLSLRRADGSWQVFGAAQGLGPGSIQGLAAAADGSLWLLQEDRLLRRKTDGSWERLSLPPEGRSLKALALGANGRLVLTAPDALLERDPAGSWAVHALSGLGLDAAIGPDGSVAVATVAQLQLRRPGAAWETLSLGQSGLDALPLAVAFDSTGRLLLGTDDGPRRLEADGSWTRWGGAAGGSFCYAVAGDASGRVLAGTAFGLLVLEGQSARLLQHPAPAVEHVSSIAFEAGGAAWLALPRRGIARLAPDGGLSLEGEAGGLGTDAVWDLALDGDTLWVATADRGLRQRRADGSWTGFDRSAGLAADEVSAVHVDAIGQVWAGHLRGLPLPGEPLGGLSLRRLDGTWTQFTTANGLADNSVRALASDSLGRLWVASYDKGLSRRDESGAWTVFDRAGGALPSDTVLALAVAPEGTVYAGTPAGLAIRDAENGLWRLLAQADGLPADEVSTLHREADGRIWIGTPGGATVLSPDGSLHPYPVLDGGLLPGRLSAIATSPDGTVWLASQDAGLSILGGAWRTDR